MPDRLTFVINPIDEFSSFDLLIKSLEDIKRLLRDVDHSMYGRKPGNEWIVRSIRSSAPTITLTPKREDTQAVLVIGEGLRLVTAGTDQPPPHFTEPVFEDLKRMKRLFNGPSKAHSLSVLIDEEQTAIITEDIAQQAERILASGYRNLGSLQGRLEAISAHNSLTATIWDRVSGAPVRWSFPRDELERVKALFEKRVLISGEIRYFSNGAPRSIVDVVYVEDLTNVHHSARAGFGSIPDQSVQELGPAEWLQLVRGEKQE